MKSSTIKITLLSIFSLFLVSANSYAQVDVENGPCEDSTCTRRALVILGFDSGQSVSTATGGIPASQPTCTPSGATTETASCDSGYTGTMSRLVSTICPDGSYGQPSTSYGQWDKIGCVAAVPTNQFQYSIYAQYSRIPAGYARIGYVDPRVQGGGGTITPKSIGDFDIFMIDTGNYSPGGSGSLALWIYGSWPRNKFTALKLDNTVIPVSEAKNYFVWKPNPEYNGNVTVWQWDAYNTNYNTNWAANTWHTMTIIP
jgi:hypothetical protein